MKLSRVGYALPSGWSDIKFKNIVPDFFAGTTPLSNKNEYYDGDIKWVTIGDIKSKYTAGGKRNISDRFLDEFPRRFTLKGSLLFTFKLSVGQVSFASNDFITNEAIISIPPSSKYSIEYLYYSMPIFVVKNAIKNIYDADLLNRELIKDSNFILPPLPEQKAIATFLDQKTTLIDSKLKSLQKEIELLKEFRKTVINDVVTGKIKVIK